MEPPLLLKPAEAAAFLGIGTSTMRRLLATGEIAAVRIGRSVRVLRAEAVRWANEREPVEPRAADLREHEAQPLTLAPDDWTPKQEDPK